MVSVGGKCGYGLVVTFLDNLLEPSWSHGVCGWESWLWFHMIVVGEVYGWL